LSPWSRISVVMIALNAEEVLPSALRSIPPQAEVIVADGGSKDRTVEIALAHGARVVSQDHSAIARANGNFDVARNAAAERSTRPWVLFLDCDERLTPELVKEVENLLGDPTAAGEGSPPCAAYDIPRVNLFWGKPVRLMGEDRQLRLMQKAKGRYAGPALHQKLVTQDSVGHLNSPILHENIRRWKDVARRYKRYIPIEARAYPATPTFWQALATPYHMFRHYYFHNQAWRDGARGLLVCLVYAFYHGAVAWAARKVRYA